jgi:branched-chain amino acid transport system permease protein
MELTAVSHLILNGIALGGIYAIQAYALYLILSFANVLNIAHGVFFVLGAAILTFTTIYLGLNIALGISLIVIIFIPVGLLFARFIVNPLSGRGHETLIASIVITFGLTLLLEGSLSYVWTRLVDPNPIFITPYARVAIEVFGVHVSLTRLILLLFAGVVTLGFNIFLKKTYQGKAIRAIASSQIGAQLVGVDIRSSTTLIITLAVVLSAVSGSFYSLAITVDPYRGLIIVLWALIVIALGGMSLLGVLIGGMIIGLAETFAGWFFGIEWAQIVLMLFFISLAMFKREGLLGRV